MIGTPVAVMVQATAVPAERAILAAMADSAAGWNAGDLDRFVAIYADDAVFVTAKGLVRGRLAIADRYRASFADGGNRRGRLTFTDPVFRRIDARHQLLWARWRLVPADPSAKAEAGMTTLVLELRPEGWRIVSDHSS